MFRLFCPTKLSIGVFSWLDLFFWLSFSLSLMMKRLINLFHMRGDTPLKLPRTNGKIIPLFVCCFVLFFYVYIIYRVFILYRDVGRARVSESEYYGS